MFLYLPEPPSLNKMLDFRGGGWQVYKGKQVSYQKKCRLLLPQRPSDAPWERWAITTCHFRLWSLRDPLELHCGAKWAVDVLVEDKWVRDDAPKYLTSVVPATQEMCRPKWDCFRGLTLQIERLP
jgi:hypothetical protein